MGKYVNNGKVTLGTSVDVDDAVREVAQLVGVGRRADGRHHLSDVCIGRGINMWAKYKPEDYNTQAHLNIDQRKANGFGIVISGASNITIKNLADLHKVQFIYQRPTTWKRLRDFNGYVHTALPKPKGSIDSEGYYNDEDLQFGGLGANVEYPTDDTGVDFTERLIGNMDKDTVLSRAFPCILLTKNDGTSYFTALTYSEDDSYRPLLKNGVYATSSYYCKLSKKTMDFDIEQNSPFNKSETVTASIFLMQSASNLLPLLVMNGTNFGTQWVKAISTLASTYDPIIAPGAIGQTISLKQYFSGIIFAPVSVSVSILGSNVTFRVPITEVTGASSTNEITYTITVRLSDGNQGSRTATLQGYTHGTEISTLPITIDGLVHVSGKTYSGTATVTTKDGNNTNTRSITFTNIG